MRIQVEIEIQGLRCSACDESILGSDGMELLNFKRAHAAHGGLRFLASIVAPALVASDALVEMEIMEP